MKNMLDLKGTFSTLVQAVPEQAYDAIAMLRALMKGLLKVHLLMLILVVRSYFAGKNGVTILT
jgi:hypothetical protein